MAAPKVVHGWWFDTIAVQTFIVCGAVFKDTDGLAVVAAAHSVRLSLQETHFDQSRVTLTAKTAVVETVGHISLHHLRGKVNSLMALLRTGLLPIPDARRLCRKACQLQR